MLGPSLLLLPAVGFVVGGGFVAAGRMIQACAPWGSPSARAFWVTAGCELLHFTWVLGCSWQALMVYLTRDAASAGRETYGGWFGFVFVACVACRFLADAARGGEFQSRECGIGDAYLALRTASVTFGLQLLGVARFSWCSLWRAIGCVPGADARGGTALRRSGLWLRLSPRTPASPSIRCFVITLQQAAPAGRVGTDWKRERLIERGSGALPPHFGRRCSWYFRQRGGFSPTHSALPCRAPAEFFRFTIHSRLRSRLPCRSHWAARRAGSGSVLVTNPPGRR